MIQSDAEFDAMLRSLDRNGDRTRSAIYFLLVVFCAIGLYTLNAYVFKFSTARVQTRTAEFASLLSGDRTCNALAKEFDFDPSIDPKAARWPCYPRGAANAETGQQTWFADLRRDIIAHEMNRLVDERMTREETFTMPIVSITFEGNLFWFSMP